MWGQRQPGRVAVTVGVLLLAGFPAAESASSNPAQDYAESDIILVDTTWTGTVELGRGIVVPAGRTLTIHNATVKWNTTNLRHFGFNIDPLGTLVVRDSTLTNNQTWGSDFQKTEAYWDFFSKGRIDVQRSTIKHVGDISLELDTSSGSILRDVQLPWMARGVHVLRSNLTDSPGWDLEMENVHIRDMPIVTGAGTADIGGAIGVLNGDLRIRNVTIERARTTGVFIDRSAVSDDTDRFGNTVEARELVVIAGAPPGMTGQGALMQVRTTGSFLCEQCTFVSPTPGGGILVSDGHTITMRDTTLVDVALGLKLPATTSARFEGLELRGPTAGIRFLYANHADPVFERVRFDAGAEGGVVAERLELRDLRGVWWGDASGPRDDAAEDGSVPLSNAGTGRPVVGSIDYSGWLATPPERNGLRLTLGSLPEAVPPGTTLNVPFTLVNGATAAVDATLRGAGVLVATPSILAATLLPGDAVSGTLTIEVPSTALPTTIVGATLLASAPGQRAAAHASTVVGATVPRIRLDAPLPYAEIDGTFTASGIVIEPTSLQESTSIAGGPPDANGDAVDDRAQLAPGRVSVLMRHEEGDTSSLRAAIEAAGGHVIRDFGLSPILWAFVPSPELPTLAARDDVRDIWWDAPVEMQLAYASRAARARTSVGGVLPGGTAPDVDYAGVWRGDPQEGYQGVTGQGVLMAVIDSGIDLTHVSLDDMDDDATTLDAKVAARISTFTVLATEAADVALSSLVLPGSHATMVAGTAAGTGAQFLGPVEAPIHGTTADDPWLFAGVAPGARIVDIDAYEDTSEQTSQLPPIGFGAGTLLPNAGFGLALEGFEAVATWNRDHPEERIRIVQISLSLGSTDVLHPFNEVANALAEQDVLVVVAVGNNHPGAIVPATASKVLAVGATKMFGTVGRLDDGKASFSDVSNAVQLAAGVRKPELMAPGSVIAMPKKDSIDLYQTSEGTSFAAPIVSGVAALVLEANPDLHAAQVKEILIRSSEPRGGATGLRYTDVNLDFEDDLEDGGWDPKWGYGYVDAEEAVRLARETTPRSPPASPTLTLFGSGSELRVEPPEDAAVVFGNAEWSYDTLQPLSLGDGDPQTDETAILVLSAPSTELGPSSHMAVASLYRDDTLVSRFTLVDDRISASTEQVPLRLPMTLGRTAEMVLRGPDTGTIEFTGSLDVLDENGTLQLAEGQALRLVLAVNHTGGAPAPIVTGPSGTQITFRLDPSTLPNSEGPSAVPGTSADWTSSSVTLHWGPAADDRGIGSYLVLRDGELLATVSGSRHTYVDSVGPAETHRYRVRAVDLHGLVGPLGPEIVVATPSATGRSVVVDVAGTSARAVADLPSHATWSAELSPLALGRHQLRATLFSDGEPVGSQVIPITVRTPANAPPTVSLTGITEVLHGARSFAVEIADPNGDADITEREWRIDGGTWRPLADASLLLDAASIPAGPHVLEARATDASGATAIDSLAIGSEPWSATIGAPEIIPDGVATLVTIDASGAGLTASALRLVGSGAASFDLPVSDAFSVLLPPLPSGLLRLEVRTAHDVLAQATRVVDKPPVAVIVAPDTDGSRLDTIVLSDASIDDSGFAQRLWTLPDGTTSTARVLAYSLRNTAVGDHTVHLAVTNLNGLGATASVPIHVEDLAPTIVASPFRLNGATVTHAYTGETIKISVNVSDPEGDPMTIGGGLVVDGVLAPAAAGLTNYSARPLEAGSLDLAVSAADAWKSTSLARSIPVHANTPPVASILAPASADAMKTTYIDTRGSRDPDRAIVSRLVAVEGHGTFTTERPAVWLPMGAWPVTLSVTDTSGATTTNQTIIKSDDWLQMTFSFTEAPNAISGGELLVSAKWHDGLPAAGAQVELILRHAYLGFERTITGVTDAAGQARLSPGTDTGAVNLPGPHELELTVRHDSRVGAPIQDVESVRAAKRYDV